MEVRRQKERNSRNLSNPRGGVSKAQESEASSAPVNVIGVPVL